VFRENAEPDVISKTIRADYVDNSIYYSRKWIFMLNGKIVRAENQEMPEVDKPVQNDDVFFSFEDCSDYLQDGQDFLEFRKDDEFRIKTNKKDEDTHYFILELETCH